MHPKAAASPCVAGQVCKAGLTHTRKIWLTRHGESEYNTRALLGGNSGLSPKGQAYARQLPDIIVDRIPLVSTQSLQPGLQPPAGLHAKHLGAVLFCAVAYLAHGAWAGDPACSLRAGACSAELLSPVSVLLTMDSFMRGLQPLGSCPLVPSQDLEAWLDCRPPSAPAHQAGMDCAACMLLAAEGPLSAVR